MTEPFRIYPLNEKALTIEFGAVICPATLQRITQFNLLLTGRPFDGLITTVPAYTSLSIFFDPIRVMKSRELNGKTAFQRVSAYLTQLEEPVAQVLSFAAGPRVIPVCYGREFGPDLNEVAETTRLSPEEVTRLHSSVTYIVYMIGFVPGFAYLGGMPQVLATPRRPEPRMDIRPGSVGIAGNQTGIYPLQTPGGWQIIGRTPLILFDAHRADPSFLKAGDRVTFQPITPSVFKFHTR